MTLDVAITLPQLGHRTAASAIHHAAVQAEALGSVVWVRRPHHVPGRAEPPVAVHVRPALTSATAAASRPGWHRRRDHCRTGPLWLAAPSRASTRSPREAHRRDRRGLVAPSSRRWELVHGRGPTTRSSASAPRGRQGVSFGGQFHRFDPVKICRHPHPIPSGCAARPNRPTGARRVGDATTVAPGFCPSAIAKAVSGRDERPDPSTFVFSLYTHDWDPGETGAVILAAQRVQSAGVQCVMAALSRRDADSGCARRTSGRASRPHAAMSDFVRLLPQRLTSTGRRRRAGRRR
jgi:hypothetical protein